MRGGMEDVDGAEVYFQGEHRVGKGGNGRGEARDARGERFIVVEMDLGYSGCVGACAHVYGKKALTEVEIWDGMEFREGRGGG